MEVTVIIGLLVVFISLFIKKYGFELSFIIITIFLAIRYDFGNDYMPYLLTFERIKDMQFNLSLLNGLYIEDEHVEIGWILLNKVCAPIGFFGLVILISCFVNYSFYVLIKKYVDSKYYWFAIFIYVFTPNLMLVNSSMMRQSMAISIFILSIKYIFDRKIIVYFLFTLLAISFHFTAILMIPIYFISFLKINCNRNQNIYLFVIMILCFLFAYLFKDSLLSFTQFLFSRYSAEYNMLDSRSGGTGLFIILTVLLFFLSFTKSGNVSENKKKVLFISYLYILTLIFSTQISVLNRASLYLLPFSIIIYSNLIEHSLNYNKFMYIILIISPIIYMFYNFFYSSVWSDKFMFYQTIFSTNWQ